MNNNNQAFYYNTWFIVMMFIVCWPVGIALLILRANASKANMFDSGASKISMVVGVILCLAALGSFSDSVGLGIFFLIGGIALIKNSLDSKKKVERYKNYIDLIGNRGIVSLDTVSNTMGIPYDKARKEVQQLIDKGSFRGANINDLTRSVELIPVAPMNQEYIPPVAGNGMLGAFANAVAGNQQPQSVTATCPGCGGTMVSYKGATVECDYCGKIFTA
ncbi:MAG: hypothetical protein K6G69_02190 [Lachnospiraceae bacterium]|nr:hypothetical protein [Lachnospiraceae bacterium]